MRTIVYVDGFNLYYGSLKNTPFKWLDLPLLFETILQPHHDIRLVKYFTATISGTPQDQSAPQRQATYLRALQQFRPSVEVHLGHFLSHPVQLPLAQPTADQRKARVIKTEEKGSDVNLAVHLLNDAWLGHCDCAVVVTNDSDIAEAMRLVKKHRVVRIGLVTPGQRRERRTSRQLKEHADFLLRIGTNALQASQLPSPIPNTSIHKPGNW